MIFSKNDMDILWSRYTQKYPDSEANRSDFETFLKETSTLPFDQIPIEINNALEVELMVLEYRLETGV